VQPIGWEYYACSNCASCQNGFFPTRLKGNKVGIDKRKTSRVIVREKLSKRAVMKEDGLRTGVSSREEINTIGT